jgi:hypothetical protein
LRIQLPLLKRKQNVPSRKSVAASLPLLKALKRKSVLQRRLKVKQNVAAKAQQLTLRKERRKEKSVALKTLLPKASRKRDAKKERRKTAARSQERNNSLLLKNF